MCLRPALLALLILPVSAFAQKNRSVRLPVMNDGIYVLDLQSKMNVQPGDTLLIPKSVNIKSVKLSGVRGTKEKPIVITQEDTSARIGGYKAYGFSMLNSSFVKMLHIHVDGQKVNKGVGFLMSRGCSDFTIENCSSENNGIGFQCKVTPDKDDPQSVYPTEMKNIRIENCSASNNITEGFYIGYSGGAKDTGLKAVLIDNVYMNNIRAVNNGWDGVQITRTQNFTGKNFYVTKFGMGHTFGQNSGIAIQSDVTGTLDGFEITDGDGAGLTIFARGKLQVKNGKIKNVGNNKVGDAIYVNDFPTGYQLPPLQLYFENVSIDGFTRFPINVVNRFKSMKPGAFKNVQFKNGRTGKKIFDLSGTK